MNKSILFVTGNASKIDQAKDILDTYNIRLNTDALDVHEIQASEPLEIVKHKVLAAFEKLQKPLVVCDHFWEFHGLNGWPGGYMKDMNHWLNEDDFINLMHGKKDRSVTLTEAIAYTKDGKHIEIFTALFSGTVVEKPKGIGYVPCERVVRLGNNTKTIAETKDAGIVGQSQAKSAWHDFARFIKSNV